jgi:hypothetical protein
LPPQQIADKKAAEAENHNYFEYREIKKIVFQYK